MTVSHPVHPLILWHRTACVTRWRNGNHHLPSHSHASYTGHVTRTLSLPTEAIATADETTLNLDDIQIQADDGAGDEEPTVDPSDLLGGASEFGGDMGGGESNGGGFGDDPRRGRPQNRADSPFVQIVPFARLPLQPDLYFLSVAYWEAHDLPFAELTADEQGARINEYLKAVCLEHFVADQKNPEDQRQYAPELLFTGALRKLAELEAQAAMEKQGEDLRRALADKLQRNGVEQRVIDLVLAGGDDLG